eukprot:1150497-Pelagomonas_calceolata.AAC.4
MKRRTLTRSRALDCCSRSFRCACTFWGFCGGRPAAGCAARAIRAIGMTPRVCGRMCSRARYVGSAAALETGRRVVREGIGKRPWGLAVPWGAAVAATCVLWGHCKQEQSQF